MAFLKASLVADIPEGTKKKVEINGMAVLIVNVESTFYAMANKCPHMGGSLADGNLQGNIIVCPRHGAKFDVTTAKSVGNAKLAFFKMKVKDGTSFPVKVQDNEILVDLG